MSLRSPAIELSSAAFSILPRRSRTRASDFVALMKPRVMSLVVFTAAVGLLIAPVRLSPLVGLVAISCIAVGAGAAGVFNMWYDADIDSVMRRTASRPIPRGRISGPEALAFGIILAVGSVTALGLAVNVAAAALLAFTIFFYAVVYTMWLKRRTAQNIVIGGAAGAAPPMIGWVAATGRVELEPLILSFIIFLWTPPHFWALSLNRVGDYALAGIPMLPVVAGGAETRRQIFNYSVSLALVSILPWALGFAGALYGATAIVIASVFVGLALRLKRSPESDRRPARRLFVFSILYLFSLFACLLVDAVAFRGHFAPAEKRPDTLMSSPGEQGAPSRVLLRTQDSILPAHQAVLPMIEWPNFTSAAPRLRPDCPCPHPKELIWTETEVPLAPKSRSHRQPHTGGRLH